MADAHLVEYNASLPTGSPLFLNRNYINRTFTLFSKKKEAAVKK